MRDLEKMMDVLTKGVDFSDERDFMVREGDNNDLILKVRERVVVDFSVLNINLRLTSRIN